MNTSNGNSRREFVKHSSLIAGGLIAAPFLSNANYFSGADDTIKIALVGCGGRGTGAIVQALSTKQNAQAGSFCAYHRYYVNRSRPKLRPDLANTPRLLP